MSTSSSPPRRGLSGPRPSTSTKHPYVGGPVPRADRDALVALANERSASVSALLREAICRYLEEERGRDDS